MLTHYQGQVSQKEFIKVLNVHYGAFRWMRWVSAAILGSLLVAIILTLLRGDEIARYLFPSALFPFIFLSFPWWAPYLQLSSFSQKGSIYRGPVSGMIDDAGVSIHGVDVKANATWQAFTHYKKTGDVLLLYQGKNNFNIFTRSMFRDEQTWNGFVEFIGKKLA